MVIIAIRFHFLFTAKSVIVYIPVNIGATTIPIPDANDAAVQLTAISA